MLVILTLALRSSIRAWNPDTFLLDLLARSPNHASGVLDIRPLLCFEEVILRPYSESAQSVVLFGVQNGDNRCLRAYKVSSLCVQGVCVRSGEGTRSRTRRDRTGWKVQ
jgi:hypothetical protein